MIFEVHIFSNLSLFCVFDPLFLFFLIKTKDSYYLYLFPFIQKAEREPISTSSLPKCPQQLGLGWTEASVTHVGGWNSGTPR